MWVIIMNKKNVSMQLIAQKVGVSKVTVSKVINNQPGVSEDVRKKVLEIVKSLGYSIERKDRSPSTRKFAFLIPKRYFFENENFYSSIFYYLNKECMANDLTLTMFVINSEEERNLIISPLLNSNNFDGIFVSGEIEENYLHSLLNLKMPIVLIDFYKPDIELDCVLVDNFFVSYTATMYLIQNGHRKIGFVGNTEQASSIADRFFGYQKALWQNNLEYKKEWHIVNNDPVMGFYSMDFPLPLDMPTAYLCYCDMAAYFLIKKIESIGLKVPDDVSIISFDNTEISQTSIPMLTTIDINKKTFAAKAFELMKHRISNRNAPFQRVIISTKMIKRDSVKKFGSTINFVVP